MSSTLASRLKVLVAKSFKAERLYGSMVISLTGQLDTELAERAKLSNEIRAREWQKSYNKLRLGLNSILSEEKSATAVTERLLKLETDFRVQIQRAAQELEKVSVGIKDALSRAEYAVVYRRSMDLVKYQARIQASEVVCEEVLALLDAKKPILNLVTEDLTPAPVKEVVKEKSKVIPFIRKASAS